VIALCTVLCGGESCVDMADFAEEKEGFLRDFLCLSHGLPSHDTFSRVFRALGHVSASAIPPESSNAMQCLRPPLDHTFISIEHLDNRVLAIASESQGELVLADRQVAQREIGQPFRQGGVDVNFASRRVPF